jgi:hypothetical protein
VSISLSWKNPNSIFDKIVIYRHTAAFELPAEATLVAEITNGAESYVDPVTSGDYYYRVGSYVAGTVMLSNMVFKSSSEAWSPKSLFINGRKGYFFDFRDRSQMFKNYYGQSPDVDGKVRMVRDLSGNNNHMRIPTVSFQNSVLSGLYNLIEDNGLKMSSLIGGLGMNENSVTGTNGKGLFVSAAIKTPSSTGGINNGYDMSRQVFTSWVSGTGADFVLGYADGTFSIYLEPNIVSSPYVRASSPTPVNTKIVVSAETNVAGTKLYLDGVLKGQSPSYTANPRLDGLGAYNTTSSYGGTIYAAVAIFDELTTQEKTNLENWMASLVE